MKTINSVIVSPLKIIADDRGAVMHMLRADAPHYQSFGEIYFSVVNPGVVKAWRRHRDMTVNLACVAGAARLVICDAQAKSGAAAVQEIDLGPGNPDTYRLVTINPGLWYGFACQGDVPAVLANCASIPHDPGEAESLPQDTDQIAYLWP